MLYLLSHTDLTDLTDRGVHIFVNSFVYLCHIINVAMEVVFQKEYLQELYV